ncbi:MAG: hypothetical protein RhofKO_27690 [Rhodothermales bacterium]
MSRVRALIEGLIHQVLEAFPPGIAYPRTVFDRAPMPPPLAHFLGRTLDHCSQLEIERLRGAASEWFDADDTGAVTAREHWLASLQRQAQVPASEWERMVEQAAHNTVSYLIRPTTTLVKFVFQGEDGPLAAPVVRRRVRYFNAYGYLGDAVDTYFNQKAVLHIEQDRFASLLHRVDRHLTEDYTPARWASLLAPLYDTVGSREGLPVGVLRLFFHEKGRADLEDRLYQAERKHGLLMLTPEQLVDALTAPPETMEEEAEILPEATPITAPPTPLAALTPVALPPAAEELAPVDALPEPPRTVEEEATEAPPAVPEPAEAFASPHPDPIPTHHEPTVDDDADGLVPLWKQFQARNETVPAPPEPVTPIAPEPPPSSDEPEPLWKQFQRKRDTPESLVDPRPPTPEPTHATAAAVSAPSSIEREVLGAPGVRQRDQFIKQLFDGSEADYLAFVEHLADEPTWAAASQRIAQEVFRPRRINIYSPVAVAFTDAAEVRFRTA